MSYDGDAISDQEWDAADEQDFKEKMGIKDEEPIVDKPKKNKMNNTWEDELKKDITELMFAYYEHGANMHTIIPDADAKPILDKIHSLLKQQGDGEHILCSAIWYDDRVCRQHLPINIQTGVVACGLRHCNCFALLSAIDNVNLGKTTQGFLTSKNRFVGRTEALKIAVEANQVDKRYSEDGILYSEDLF